MTDLYLPYITQSVYQEKKGFLTFRMFIDSKGRNFDGEEIHDKTLYDVVSEARKRWAVTSSTANDYAKLVLDATQTWKRIQSALEQVKELGV